MASFAALAVCIHLFESSLPSIMGIKPGLANIITLIVLIRYDLVMACQVQILRVVIGSLLNGSIFTPTFFLSLSGSIAALTGLAIIYLLVKFLSRPKTRSQELFSKQPGPIGYSVVAAMMHMSGQFLLAYFWLIPHQGLFKLLPILLCLALLFGWVNGIMTYHILEKLPPKPDALLYAA